MGASKVASGLRTDGGTLIGSLPYFQHIISNDM